MVPVTYTIIYICVSPGHVVSLTYFESESRSHIYKTSNMLTTLLKAYQVLPVRRPSLKMNTYRILCWLFIHLFCFYIQSGHLVEVCPLLVTFERKRGNDAARPRKPSTERHGYDRRHKPDTVLSKCCVHTRYVISKPASIKIVSNATHNNSGIVRGEPRYGEYRACSYIPDISIGMCNCWLLLGCDCRCVFLF